MNNLATNNNMPSEQTQNWELPSYDQHQFFARKAKYMLLIPVINEGQRIRTQLDRMQNFISGVDVVIVDGGSTDGSLEHEYLRAKNVRSLLVKTGPGKLSAQLRIGLAYAMLEGYEGVILIDGNNKDDPDAIPDFVKALDSGIDHVQGSRFISGGQIENNPASRLWGIKLLHAPLISLAAGRRYTDTTNGFRAYSRRLITDPRVMPFRDIFSQYELHYYMAIRAGRLGFKISELPVARRYPPGEIPTKIKGMKGNILVLETLFRACLGFYNPKLNN